MDPHDPAHGSHPSQPIPDAAYPDDSPYQPGGGSTHTGSRPSLGGVDSSSHLSHLDTTPSYSPVSSRFAPSPWTVPDPQGPLPAIPSGPPPPYDHPTRPPPSAYSPLDTASALHSSAAVQPASPGLSHLAPPSPYSVRPPPPSPPNPYGSSGSSLDNGPPKLGPVAEARLRRRRKQKLCAFAACAVLLFLVAVAVGVALGVHKVQLKGNDDDDDERGSDNTQD
ncbi:hypothetical protein AK830_g6684 [Neonectria ditissima]|uniref:Uncharacterized protein n=1 Tax=Neonectria ditissima TaxID=78410 RepID=A0A0P7APX0_9HYPO|nr:hypothetical protein AK830_g6684 [Neonectria ditissima]